MVSVDSIIEVTNEMELTLIGVKQSQREEVIKKLDILLTKREELLTNLKDVRLSDEEKMKLAQVNMKNEKIVKDMILLSKAIQKDLLHAKKGKTAFTGYHQYENPSVQDGYYIDKKK